MTAAEREVARRALLDLLADQLDRRRPVPCLAGPLSSWWTSDDDGQQQIAADACLDCSAFAGCRAYGDRYRLESGVYGGRTERERLPRRGRPPTTTKESAA